MPKYKHRKSETLGPIRRNPSRRARVGDKTDPRNPRRYSDPVMDLDSSPTNVRPQYDYAFVFPPDFKICSTFFLSSTVFRPINHNVLKWHSTIVIHT